MNEQIKTKAQHTPGPWEISRDDAYPPRYLLTSKGSPFASLDGWACDGVTTDEDDAANRNLIAAAPELLDALKGLFEHCAMIHRVWGDGSNQKEADAAIAAGKAAIAKAEGRE
ncbi:MAG: hypothetical protein RBU21_04550 [FCB group bacterium]|jgi:hypothetical protein|nr:hypothetical protein [FCB group bacterium]